MSPMPKTWAMEIVRDCPAAGEAASIIAPLGFVCAGCWGDAGGASGALATPTLRTQAGILLDRIISPSRLFESEQTPTLPRVKDLHTFYVLEPS
jgi:hypothetical protein